MVSNNKYNVLDTFAGAGGFSLGFQLTNHYEIVGAIEQDKWAAETFSTNHPNTNVIVGDIRNVSDATLKEQFYGNVDILLGGPPCQGFSQANKNAGDPKDPRNSLFKEFIRVAKVVSPQIVIMENVPNIIKAKTASGDKVIDIIHQELSALGYAVEHTILSATDFGVPQIRKRMVLIASKKKLSAYFPTPTHSIETDTLFTVNLQKCPTLWDAISDLPQIEASEGADVMDYVCEPKNELQRLLRGESPKIYNHTAMKHSKRMVERFKAIKCGESSADVPKELYPRKRNGNGEISETAYDQNNRRMFPDRPCHTIAASFYANFLHPFCNRNFTPREGARVQTFPDWYVFKGRPTTPSHSLLRKEGRLDELHLGQYNQIGNAVPPLMAKAIADNIFIQLKEFENE